MSKRLDWNNDGTLVYYSNDGGSTIVGQVSAANQNILNSSKVYNGGVWANGDGPDPWVIFNFPAPITLTKLGIAYSNTDNDSTRYVEVSSDSTNGLDGTWSQVYASGITESTTLQEVSLTPLSATWMRIRGNYIGGLKDLYLYRIHLFGEYDAPRFEFYDTSGLTELTSDYPLLLANAPNFEDYAGSTGFRIKNTDTEAHTYALSLQPNRYGGDAVISNNFKLSKDGGVSKEGSITLNAIAAGAMSELIGVYGDVVIASNPADGYHYFVVRVQETS